MIHLDLFLLFLARPSPHRPLDPTSKRGFDLPAEPIAARDPAAFPALRCHDLEY
ncbi:hypothetical protein ABAC402_18170 [Asticcacaulis sp. AC402]|nr:hypothetical protein ABAC402_18170 [Asticcacaulis sp. AC402]